MTQGLHRFCGSNDLHVLTFSRYRRRPLFRNEAYSDLFLKILERFAGVCRLVVLGSSPCRNTFMVMAKLEGGNILAEYHDPYRSPPLSASAMTPQRPSEVEST